MTTATMATQWGPVPLWVYRAGVKAAGLYGFLCGRWGGGHGGRQPIWASPATMATAMTAAVGSKISERSIYRLLATLKAQGAIRVTRNRMAGGYLGRATYYLAWDDPFFPNSLPATDGRTLNHTNCNVPGGRPQEPPGSSRLRPKLRGNEVAARRSAPDGLRCAQPMEPVDTNRNPDHVRFDLNSPENLEDGDDGSGLLTFAPVPVVRAVREETVADQTYQQEPLFPEPVELPIEDAVCDPVDISRESSDTGGEKIKGGTEKRGWSPTGRLIAYWLRGRKVTPDRKVIPVMGKVIKRCLGLGITEEEIVEAFDDLMLQGVDDCWTALPAFFGLRVYRQRKKPDWAKKPLRQEQSRTSTRTPERNAELRAANAAKQAQSEQWLAGRGSTPPPVRFPVSPSTTVSSPPSNVLSPPTMPGSPAAPSPYLPSVRPATQSLANIPPLPVLSPGNGPAAAAEQRRQILAWLATWKTAPTSPPVVSPPTPPPPPAVPSGDDQVSVEERARQALAWLATWDTASVSPAVPSGHDFPVQLRRERTWQERRLQEDIDVAIANSRAAAIRNEADVAPEYRTSPVRYGGHEHTVSSADAVKLALAQMGRGRGE